MHGDEPDMQLRPGPRDASCSECHPREELSASGTHNGHGAHGHVEAPPDCLDCHMPRIVYGLLEGMISHRITSPTLEQMREDDGLAQPDACTRCHVDRSRTWVRELLPGLARGELGASPRVSPDASELSRIELELLSGDPLVRNLAAHALARPRAVGDEQRRRRALLEAMDDLYPSVRWFAWKGLRQLDGEGALAGVEYDYLAAPETRAQWSRELGERLGPPLLEGRDELRDQLASRSDDSGLWIGE